MISAEVAEVIDWMGTLVLWAALIVPLLVLGYGLAGFMLYRWSGKGEEVETWERTGAASSCVKQKICTARNPDAGGAPEVRGCGLRQ